MPAFSGLWDGVHGDPYASDNAPQPPHMGGIGRVIMQKRGSYGFAKAFGATVPASRKVVSAAMGDVEMRGGYDYATRTDDAANTVVVVNAGEPVRTLDDQATLAAATADDLDPVIDTTLNNGYPADAADNGVTSKELVAAP